MDMTSILEKLKRLQEVLVQKYELEAKVTDNPEQISLQKSALDADRQAFINKNAEWEAERDKVNKLHLDLETAMKVRESGEKGMDDISTHREYEALDKQISEATLREQDLRRELQVEEKILADLTDSMKEDEQSIKAQEEELKGMQESFDQEMSGYKAKLVELEAQETAESEGIDSEVLFKFHRIIQRNSDGIVSVKGGVCSGCRMILPTQFANEVRRGDGIMFCPYCSRILFYEETGEDESFQFDAGSLVDLEDDSGIDAVEDDEEAPAREGGDYDEGASEERDADESEGTDDSEEYDDAENKEEEEE